MINEQKYLSKITDTFVFIEDMVNIVNEDFVFERAYSMGEGVREIIKDPQIWTRTLIPSEEGIQKIINDVVKTKTAKVRNYKKWVLGYGLVLICGIFDEYLYELLDNILDTNQQLTNWTDKKDILSKFENCTFKEKYKIFTTKLKILPEDFFDFSIFIPKIQRKYSGINLDSLVKIYKKRNKVAHTDSYVVYTMDELSNYVDLFQKMIWNLSIKCRQRWHIRSEFLEGIKKK